MTKPLIPWEKLDRFAISVPDLDGFVRDSKEIFGIDFAVMDAPDFNIRAGLSDSNLELVERLDPSKPTTISGNWYGNTLVAIGFKVPDVEQAKAVLRERGIDIYDNVEVETPGGLKESYLTRTEAFGGLPLSLESYPGESFVGGVSRDFLADPNDKTLRADHQCTRVGLVVPDADAAARDFTEVFGIEFVSFDQPELRLHIAASDAGLILVSHLDASNPSPIAPIWAGGVVASLGFDTDDPHKLQAKLATKGCEPVYKAETPGGASLYVFEAFHGFPLAIYSRQEGSWLDATGIRKIPVGQYQATLTWFRQPAA